MTIHTDNSKVIENLQNENAELRECIKEALEFACDGCRHAVWNNQKFVRCKRHKNWKCLHGTERWRAALEGVNHAND